MENKKVIILRGISGAGKSTYIKNNFPTAKVCSADHYFMQNGMYKFNPKQLTQAHNSCQLVFRNLLADGEPLVVVDNTNTKFWEFEKYLTTAEKFGYNVEVIRLSPNWVDAANRNVHGVPEQVVRAMNDRMEPYDGEVVLTDY